MLKAMLFSSFRVDYNIFKNFKKDFWKEFIDNDVYDEEFNED